MSFNISPINLQSLPHLRHLITTGFISILCVDKYIGLVVDCSREVEQI